MVSKARSMSVWIAGKENIQKGKLKKMGIFSAISRVCGEPLIQEICRVYY